MIIFVQENFENTQRIIFQDFEKDPLYWNTKEITFMEINFSIKKISFRSHITELIFKIQSFLSSQIQWISHNDEQTSQFLSWLL